MKAMRLISSLFVLLLAVHPAAADRRRAVHHPEPPFNVLHTEGGYADKISVRQGDAITFFIASSVTPLRVEILNLADPDVVVYSRADLESRPQNCSGKSATGCGWTPTLTVDVPYAWPSGYYAARFPTSFGMRHAFFVVRENIPGSTSRTLVVAATHTYQAYNTYGGRSLYPSDDPTRAVEISFDRPFEDGYGLGRFDEWEEQFVRWMTAGKRTFEVASDSDLEDPTLLLRYDLVILVGHSEYWTSRARANLEAHSRAGGHVFICGSNTMWWQVRLENDGRTIICYKSAGHDPLSPIAPGLATTHFFGAPLHWPENLITGVSFRNGGYSNRVSNLPNDYTMLPVEQRVKWTVRDPWHWVFRGTNVQIGSEFGQRTTGLEVDGTLFTCDETGRVLRVEGSDGTPLNFRVLATTPGSDGWGTLGIFTNEAGGAVVNAATQNWSHGLFHDPIVDRITANVLDRLSTGVPLPYDPVQSTVLVDERFNCPVAAGMPAVPGWRGGIDRGRITARCAYEGPGGLDLAGEGPIELARNFTPTGQNLEHAYLRVYVNVDAYEKRTVWPLPLFVLQGRAGDRNVQAVLVEFENENDVRAVRVARREASGRFSASPWATLTPGWHEIELTWRSPGSIILEVDDWEKVTLENGDAGQHVNELVIDWIAAERPGVGGHICVDGLALGLEPPAPLPALRP